MAHIMVWLSILFFAVVGRAYAMISPSKPKASRPTRQPQATCHLAVFLGSGVEHSPTLCHIINKTLTSNEGGHTSEALLLLSAIDFARYTPRSYIVSQEDTLSVQRAVEFESSKGTSTPKASMLVCGGSLSFLNDARGADRWEGIHYSPHPPRSTSSSVSTHGISYCDNLA